MTMPMSFRKESPLALLRSVLAAYARDGLDPTPALRAAQIPPALLSLPHARITSRQLVHFVASAMRELNDEGIGLYSRKLPPGSFEMMTRACLSSADLGTALHRWCRYRGLMVDDLRARLDVCHGQATLTLEERSPLAQHRDLALLSYLRHAHGLASWLIDSRLPLIEATFPGPGPVWRTAYASMFPGPVRFDAPRATLRFSADYLVLPVRRDEVATWQTMHEAVALMACQYERDRLLARRVRQLLATQLDDAPTGEQMATQLHLSARTLHRQLALEQVSLQSLKDEARRARALSLLARADATPKRIATLLGYRNEKSFARAFQRWTGQTPNAWRARANIKAAESRAAPAAVQAAP